MSILWIYDKIIDPQAGGTERATYLVMTALEGRGYETAGFLAFSQHHPREVHNPTGHRVDDLYQYLKENNVHVIINQIGYSNWLLKEFLARGGQRWRSEGGRIVTKLHFDPRMFSTELRELTRHWCRKSLKQKVRRLGRIALLPLERRKAACRLRDAFSYLIEQSDYYIILSERHRQAICNMSRTKFPHRVRAIGNLNTFTNSLDPGRVPAKSNTVLIVSRLDEPQKRVSLALRAWGQVMQSHQFSDWTLRVIGDGEYAEDYRELIAKQKIANVEFFGPADPEPHYEEAAIYLHTAKREGWGLTIVEAMQKGAVPIVMHSSSVFEDYIDQGKNGILSKDGKVRPFAADIALLMLDRGLRESMALCALEATQKRDLEHILEKWLVVLTDTNPGTRGSGASR